MARMVDMNTLVYLVMSDTHGERHIIEELIHRYQDQVDVMIHCGDSELGKEDVLWQKVTVVQGNCDLEDFPETALITTDLDRILVVHGHHFGVSFGLSPLVDYATSLNASIVCYGHTHILHSEELQHMLLLNPGSLSIPRGPYQNTPTYALITSTPNQWTVTYYTKDHEVFLTHTYERTDQKEVN